MFTVEEVAQMLKVHARTVRRYIDNGQLEARKVGGVWRIPVTALEGDFAPPEGALSAQVTKRTEDMTSLYLKGEHHLQKDSTVALYVFVFNQKDQPWFFTKNEAFMALLNEATGGNNFEFTMTMNGQSQCRVTIIATNPALQKVIAGLETLKEASENVG